MREAGCSPHREALGEENGDGEAVVVEIEGGGAPVKKTGDVRRRLGPASGVFLAQEGSRVSDGHTEEKERESSVPLHQRRGARAAGNGVAAGISNCDGACAKVRGCEARSGVGKERRRGSSSAL
jgi:hypothetical protein